MPKDSITQAKLKEILHYNPLTGIFIHKHRDRKYFKADSYWKRWNTHCFNKVAGSSDGRGYLRIRITVKGYYFAHRLAFLYVLGRWPEDEVDHINHIGTDNRWCNIMETDRKGNSRNLPKSKNNKSGYTGVCWDESRGKWRSRIKVNKILIHLGVFTFIDDAIQARKQANIKYGFHENHGKVI